MKKLMFLAALLAGIIFASCSDDDSSSTNDNCVPCAFEAADEVCEGDNGNAFVNGMDTQQNFNDFVDAFCEENQNPVGDCLTCAAYEFNGQAMPETEVCESENATAIVNGMDTGVSFAQYVDAQEMFTTCE